MNFEPVGRNLKGEMYVKYSRPYNVTEKIQLLQRSILVNSFAYYEIDSNILEDYQYDNNAKQLVELMRQYPEESKRSRYYTYFKDFCSEDENIHYVSGFDLLEKVRKSDPELYRHIDIDATLALRLKDRCYA